MRSWRPRESLAQYCISVVFTVFASNSCEQIKSWCPRAALATPGNTRSPRAGRLCHRRSVDPSGALVRSCGCARLQEPGAHRASVTPAGESREGSEPTSVGAPWRTGHGPGQRDWRRLPRLCPALLLVFIACTQ